MTDRPEAARAVGAVVGVASAAPFALVVLAVFLPGFMSFAVAISTACIVSGAVTGATFGRAVAAHPTTRRLVGAPALAVIIGSPVGAGMHLLLSQSHGDIFSWTLAGILVYGLPVYLFLALPAFGVGFTITRRRSGSQEAFAA